MAVQTRTTALQNEVVRLYCRFIRDGQLTNPQGQPVVEILDSDGVTVLESLYSQIETTGMAYVDWFIPKNLPLGQYYDKWTFQWDSASCVQEMAMIFDVHSFESYINFISTGVSYQISSRAAQLLNDLANDFIFEAQHTPIYWEQGMRVQQENQRKRVKNYYYFNISTVNPHAFEGDVYTVNGQQYTVFQSLENASSSSSSSLGITSSSVTSESSISPDLSSQSDSSTSVDSFSSSSSSSNSNSSSSSNSSFSSSSFSSSSSNSSSSSSVDSHSSNSSNSLDSSSSSSSSSNSSSSSSSSLINSSDTSVSSDFINMIVLTTVGHAIPPNNGVLTKVTGDGSSTLTYSGFDAKTSLFSTIYGFAYKNWNMDPKPLVRLNNRIIDDGWHADYEGKIYFDGLMAPEDSVNTTYNFKYFSNEEMLGFLRLGLQMMNSVPPASQAYMSLESAPSIWDAGILLYAAITALKRLIFGLNWQEKMIIFGDPEAARNAQAQFKDLYASYQETWTAFAKNVKTSKLPEIAISIVPTQTLPGGRCCAASTYVDFISDNKEKKLTIKELYGEFENGKLIKIKSMKNGKVSFEDVKKIWNSGEKLTYKVCSENNIIRLTGEHLVYIPERNIYIPVFELRRGDYIFAIDKDKFIKQELISDPIMYKVEEVYDIEVPSTENFIGNNIVSHNSRFFRYLYKSGSG